MTKNVATSVRQRLLNRSRNTGETFHNLSLRYGIERLLYRLSQSDHADEFILKGASLFYVWTGQLYRPTKDVDMLRFGPTDPELLARIIESCVTMKVVDDGLVFDTDTIEARPIREVELYSGVRVTLKAYLGKAMISLQLDVGTGDSVTPDAERIEYPSLLDDMPSASLRAYRFETAIAEKCEAMIKLGMSNSRMKDFYDVFVLARDQAFEGATLVEAVRDTFLRRGTSLPEQLPVAWTLEFSQDSQKIKQWGAFLKKSRLQAPDLSKVIDVVRTFLIPVCHAARGDATAPNYWSDGAWARSSEEE